MTKIPAYQKFIIEKANLFNKRVFLSTQFLKNMEEKPVPTIAEINDLYNTFKMGVYGIQLPEETSIGKYPKE
ncbi:pyruvate kinase, partial [Chloroflexota bacterium]